MNNLNIPVTPEGKSYWDGNARYQQEYSQLYDTLVPDSGSADNLFGEVVRAVSRLSYEYYNNGNCNAADRRYIDNWEDCSYCGGSGYLEDDNGEEYPCPDCGGDGGWSDEEECDPEVNDFYTKFLELVAYFFREYDMPAAEKIVDDVTDTILRANDYQFTPQEERPYVLLADAVVYTIMNNISDINNIEAESPELPSWYERD